MSNEKNEIISEIGKKVFENLNKDKEIVQIEYGKLRVLYYSYINAATTLSTEAWEKFDTFDEWLEKNCLK
jgi:hypothetical protein